MATKEYPIIFKLANGARDILMVRLGNHFVSQCMFDTYSETTSQGLAELTIEDWEGIEDYVADQVKNREYIILRGVADEEVLVDAVEGFTTTPDKLVAARMVIKLEIVLDRNIKVPWIT